LNKFCDKILIIDSGSTDNTRIIALNNNCDFRFRSWDTYAIQFNYGVSLVDNDYDWILRIDADEYFTDDLVEYILDLKLHTVPRSVSAFSFNRRYYFKDTWIKFGVYPTRMLRLFRKGFGSCELKNMDEHILISDGETRHVNLDFIDHNKNDLFWFLNKHNSYAFREAADYFLRKFGYVKEIEFSKKRKFRNYYYHLPPFFRSISYFVVRYFVKGGFLNGRNGFIYFFYQSLYYRITIDYIIAEVNADMKMNKGNYVDSFNRLFNYPVSITNEK
jgi:glycosyltransferase involved in cell wall biosynthesis